MKNKRLQISCMVPEGSGHRLEGWISDGCSGLVALEAAWVKVLLSCSHKPGGFLSSTSLSPLALLSWRLGG